MARFGVISVIFLALISTINSIKPSMFNPPWKHCIHQLHPEKFWKEFASPGFPHGIRRQTQCSWIIVVPNPNIRIRLAFDTLNLTGSINSCYTQYVEFWEMTSASKMGQFCGDQRPGDYVSYGNAVRVDLKADTADEGHIGFLMKYKLTKEKGGFRNEYSFPKLPPGVDQDSNSNEQSPKSPPKIKKPPNTGGRINLTYLKRQRELAAKKKSTGNGTENAKVVFKRIRPQTPPQTPPSRPRPFDKEKDELIIVNGKEASAMEFELWIIVVIGVGGALFFIFLCVLTWLCFCREKKPKPKFDSPSKHRNGMETKQQFANNYSTNRQCQHLDLPGYFPPNNQFIPLENYPSYAFPQSAMPQSIINAQTSYKGKHYGHENHGVNIPKYEMRSNTLSNPERIFQEKQPLDGARIQRSQTQKETRKQVPTLKRKFSAWEKEEIRKGTLKM